MATSDQNHGRVFHDLTNSLTVIRAALYNISEIMPEIIEGYKIALQFKPDMCTKIGDKHLELLAYSLKEVISESRKLENDFERVKVDFAKQPS